MSTAVTNRASLFLDVEAKAAARRIGRPPGKSSTIRRVRTPEGVAHYHQPLRTVIFGKSRLTAMHVLTPKWEGYDRVQRVNTSTGKSMKGELYDLGYDWEAKKWRAYRADTDDVVYETDSEEDLFLGLNAQWGGDDYRATSTSAPSAPMAKDPFKRPSANQREGIADYTAYANTISDNGDYQTPAGNALASIFENYDSEGSGLGYDEVELYAMLKAWQQQYPVGTPNRSKAFKDHNTLHVWAHGTIKELERVVPGLKGKTAAELTAMVAERHTQKVAEASVPRPVKLNEVRPGMWIRLPDASGLASTWHRVTRAIDYTRSRRTFEVDRGTGTAKDKTLFAQLTNHYAIETVDTPPVGWETEASNLNASLEAVKHERERLGIALTGLSSLLERMVEQGRYGMHRDDKVAAGIVSGMSMLGEDVFSGRKTPDDVEAWFEKQLARAAVKKNTGLHKFLSDRHAKWQLYRADPSITPTGEPDKHAQNMDGLTAMAAGPSEAEQTAAAARSKAKREAAKVTPSRVESWKKETQDGTPVMRHENGIVYEWDGAWYAQGNDEEEETEYPSREAAMRAIEGVTMADVDALNAQAAKLRAEIEKTEAATERAKAEVMAAADRMFGGGTPESVVGAPEDVTPTPAPQTTPRRGTVEIVPGVSVQDWRDEKKYDDDTAAEIANDFAWDHGLEDEDGEWENFEQWTTPDGKVWDYGLDDETGNYIITPKGSWDSVVPPHEDWRVVFWEFMKLELERQRKAGKLLTDKKLGRAAGEAPDEGPAPLTGAERAAELMRRVSPPPPIDAPRTSTIPKVTVTVNPDPGARDVPVGLRLQIEESFRGDRLKRQSFSALQRASYPGQDPQKAPGLYAEVDKILAQQGESPDGRLRKGLRDWYERAFIPVGDATAPRVPPTGLVESGIGYRGYPLKEAIKKGDVIETAAGRRVTVLKVTTNGKFGKSGYWTQLTLSDTLDGNNPGHHHVTHEFAFNGVVRQDLDIKRNGVSIVDRPPLANWGLPTTPIPVVSASAIKAVGDGPKNIHDHNRYLRIGESGGYAVRDRARELHAGGMTPAAAWKQALDEHEARGSAPAPTPEPTPTVTPRTMAVQQALEDADIFLEARRQAASLVRGRAIEGVQQNLRRAVYHWRTNGDDAALRAALTRLTTSKNSPEGNEAAKEMLRVLFPNGSDVVSPESVTAPKVETANISPEGRLRDAARFEDRIEALRPFMESGPNYDRTVADNVGRARAGYQKGEGWWGFLMAAEVAAKLRPESDWDAYKGSKRGDSVSDYIDYIESGRARTPDTGISDAHNEGTRAPMTTTSGQVTVTYTRSEDIKAGDILPVWDESAMKFRPMVVGRIRQNDEGVDIFTVVGTHARTPMKLDRGLLAPVIDPTTIPNAQQPATSTTALTSGVFSRGDTVRVEGRKGPTPFVIDNVLPDGRMEVSRAYRKYNGDMHVDQMTVTPSQLTLVRKGNEVDDVINLHSSGMPAADAFQEAEKRDRKAKRVVTEMAPTTEQPGAWAIIAGNHTLMQETLHGAPQWPGTDPKALADKLRVAWERYNRGDMTWADYKKYVSAYTKDTAVERYYNTIKDVGAPTVPTTSPRTGIREVRVRDLKVGDVVRYTNGGKTHHGFIESAGVSSRTGRRQLTIKTSGSRNTGSYDADDVLTVVDGPLPDQDTPPAVSAASGATRAATAPAAPAPTGIKNGPKSYNGIFGRATDQGGAHFAVPGPMRTRLNGLIAQQDYGRAADVLHEWAHKRNRAGHRPPIQDNPSLKAMIDVLDVLAGRNPRHRTTYAQWREVTMLTNANLARYLQAMRDAKSYPYTDGEHEHRFRQMVTGEVEFKNDGEKGKGYSKLCVMLIPRVEDALDMAIYGQEEPYDLHVTILIGQNADTYDGYTREEIVRTVRNTVLGMRLVKGNAFAANVFNPKGENPCVVVGIGGKEMETAHRLITDAVFSVVTKPADMHAPWVPHMTLAYAKDGNNPLDYMPDAMDRTNREVVFDRVRVSFGDEFVDIPITGGTPASLQDRLKMMISRAAGPDTEEYAYEGRLSGRYNVPGVGEAKNLRDLTSRSHTCEYCKGKATKIVLHSEGMAYIPSCDDHLGQAKTDAEYSTPDGERDATNVDGVYEVKVGVITPGGRIGDPTSRDMSPKKNWVEEAGGMPKYMRMVRNALLRDGHSMARATAIAVNSMKRWATGKDVSPKVQAAAAEALAQWEAMKAKAHATKVDDQSSLEVTAVPSSTEHDDASNSGEQR